MPRDDVDDFWDLVEQARTGTAGFAALVAGGDAALPLREEVYWVAEAAFGDVLAKLPPAVAARIELPDALDERGGELPRGRDLRSTRRTPSELFPKLTAMFDGQPQRRPGLIGPDLGGPAG